MASSNIFRSILEPIVDTTKDVATSAYNQTVDAVKTEQKKQQDQNQLQARKQQSYNNYVKPVNEDTLISPFMTPFQINQASMRAESDAERQERLEGQPGYHGDALTRILNDVDKQLDPQNVANWEQANDIDAKREQHQDELDAWSRQRRERQDAYGENVIRRSSMGTIPYSDFKFRQDKFDRGYGDYERRLNDGNPNPIGQFGPTSQTLTPEVVRNVYEDIFGEEDRNGIRNENGITSNLTNGIIDPNTIDDGSSPESRQGFYMTGEQYMKYRKAGLPGRDIDDINLDPNVLYSKQDEADNYGFVPYLTDQDAVNYFKYAADTNFVSNVFNNFANIRRTLTDYDINYNGETYSGRDFDRNFEPWISQIPQGTEPDQMKPLTLDDGTQISAEDAINIYLAQNSEQQGEDISDTGVTFDYGKLGMGREYVTSPKQGFVPWITDMALTSAPYFFAPTAAAQAAGNVGTTLQGVRPGANFDTGTYELFSNNPTDEQVMTSVLGASLMPITERLWGPLGGQLVKGTSPTAWGVGKAIDKTLGKKARNALEGNALAGKLADIELMKSHPALRYAAGAFDEGLEEIPGNLTEELQNSGLFDWYKNKDEYGNKIPTDAIDRIVNFISDIPLSLLGGAALGGALGPVRLPEYRSAYAQKAGQLAGEKAERDKFGFNMAIPEDVYQGGDPLASMAAGTLDDYVAQQMARRAAIEALQPIVGSLDLASERMQDDYINRQTNPARSKA